MASYLYGTGLGPILLEKNYGARQDQVFPWKKNDETERLSCPIPWGSRHNPWIFVHPTHDIFEGGKLVAEKCARVKAEAM